MEEKLKYIKEFTGALLDEKGSVIGFDLTKDEIEWLIKQAETLQEIRKEAKEMYDEKIDLTDFGERVANII